MKIILIGFMGSGKSSVAEIVARKKNMMYVEMDEMVIQKSGKKSVKEIFDNGGEILFRELEISVAKDLSKMNTSSVISTGGGVVMNKIILDYLKDEDDIVVFLKTNFETITHRLVDIESRPLFAHRKSAKRLFKLRARLYQMYADIIIRTDDKTPNEVAEDILERVS